MEWDEIAVPNRSLSGWRRVGEEFRLCFQVLRRASTEAASSLILCSISAAGLLALKALMLGRRTTVPVIIVPHSILNSILPTPSKKHWPRPGSFRVALTLPHPQSLRYIALGRPILRALCRALPRVSSHFQTLDLPYLLEHDSAVVGDAPVCRFGYFGAGAKGFHLFCRLASDSQGIEADSPYDFVMVGFLRDRRNVPESEQSSVKGIGETPLSREEYSRRALSITYAVGTWRPEDYRLVASASLLDALSYVKPGIYLRNPYIEYYFERLGDIGYLCDSYEEMRCVLSSVLKAFPLARYRQQVENILRGRHIFEPSVVASQFRMILADCKRSS